MVMSYEWKSFIINVTQLWYNSRNPNMLKLVRRSWKIVVVYSKKLFVITFPDVSSTFNVCYHHQLAIANLNGVSLYGKKVHVTHSKHPQVQMPQAGSNVSHSYFLLIWHCSLLYPRRIHSQKTTPILHFTGSRYIVCALKINATFWFTNALITSKCLSLAILFSDNVGCWGVSIKMIQSNSSRWTPLESKVRFVVQRCCLLGSYCPYPSWD